MANSPERLEEMINRGKVLTYRGICNTAKEEGWFLGTDSDSSVTNIILALKDLGKIEIATAISDESNTHSIIYIIPRALIDQPAKK
jgi:hypothetical protein